ncbi:MAG: hypothetical protein JNM17_27705 [Archangium sp.]|nr:hypothetical protein [Archangium sp.]
MTSSHVVVTVTGGDKTRSTQCMAVAGQRVLDVGVAQGDFPDNVMISAEGFSEETCTTKTEPLENAVAIERRFRKGLIIDAPLLLRTVRPGVETTCANGLDDDADGQTDCADLDCTDRSCSTGNVCIAGQTCQNGSCQGGAQVTCTTPPSTCFMNAGLCVVDAGCRYVPQVGTMCDDGNDCTTMDSCGSNGDCGGQVRQCTQPPPGPCWLAAGVCVNDAGCMYSPAVGNSCADSDNCTVMDSCLADGGCEGTRVNCAPRECAMPTGTCTGDGGCLYAPFDAGISCGDAGSCNMQGGCLPPFPFVPSNVQINEVPTPSSGKVTVNCNLTIDTSGPVGPTIASCPGQPAFGAAVITQNGGLSTLVLSAADLEVSGNFTLNFTGSRPVILISMKDLLVLGAITTSAGAQSCMGSGAGGNGSGTVYKSGGGGGGFATAGGAGGNVTNGPAGGSPGVINLGTQLRGGCQGGVGGGSSQRASSGGGALQLVALDNITIAGVISAPGAGGSGGGFGNGGNGGGSGGELLLEAQQIVASGGGLTCNGGAGGEAGTGNAGQSGQLSAMPARGGTDNVVGGSGGDGAADTIGAENGEDSSVFAGGGGGGGGVGRIRLNVTNSCNLGPQVVISPPATSNRPDAGCP